MSVASTQEIFDVLSVANLPARSWDVQAFRDHAPDQSPIQVVAYGHKIDPDGAVSLTFGVNHAGTLAAFVGRFKGGAQSQITRGGSALDPPVDPQGRQQYVPIDAGADGPAPDIPLQVWYRWNEGRTLREFRFATTIHSPARLPLP
jgi:hypothetical protein